MVIPAIRKLIAGGPCSYLTIAQACTIAQLRARHGAQSIVHSKEDGA